MRFDPQIALIEYYDQPKTAMSKKIKSEDKKHALRLFLNQAAVDLELEQIVPLWNDISLVTRGRIMQSKNLFDWWDILGTHRMHAEDGLEAEEYAYLESLYALLTENYEAVITQGV